ncbi:hypothetical protein PAXINDRAFT_11185 [Paxillus involutus ATCC 200175]|nr:hypothetical protein PAXINDRAFT_11185 [Paxillus involutus ATCC 200175]
MGQAPLTQRRVRKERENHTSIDMMRLVGVLTIQVSAFCDTAFNINAYAPGAIQTPMTVDITGEDVDSIV